MKAFAAFENVVYRKKLERKFFGYCLRRQPGLLRFVPGNLAADVRRLFRRAGREEYLTKRWGFLRQVKNPEIRLERFFHKQRRNLWLPPSGTEIVTDQPEAVLAALCRQIGCTLRGNPFDLQACRFTAFRTEKEQLAGERGYTMYGTLRCPLMADAADKRYVCGRKIMTSRKRCIAALCGRTLLTHAALLLYAVLLGYASLYYAALGAGNTTALFHSYLQSPFLQLLNLAPVALVMFFLYYLCNSAAAAALVTSALTLVMSWIHYFKLVFRGDPFIFEDVQLVREAGAMTGSYAIVLTPGMWCAVAAALGVAVLFALFLRQKVQHPQVRAIVLVALLVLGVGGYRTLYCSETVYEKTYRPLSFQSVWNSSHQFQNRGFLYPFLHSTAAAFDPAPESYDETEAAEVLAQYPYADIPEERKVSVIACMLESYSDFTRFDELSFTEDPYEFLHTLEAESYSGTVVSYAFGGGTNIPERQFLTGLTSLPNFRKTTNSYPWYFRQQGYTVEGSHPYYHWFYHRSTVNGRLGFENYYFDEDTYEALNDGKPMSHDSVLFPHIVALYEQAAARDEHYFSFNVTFQGHGPYSSDVEYDHPYVENKGYSEQSYHYLNNYLAIVDDIDDALKDMVQSLRESEEPVVLILFGDHMPGLGDKDSAYEEFGISFDLATEEGFYNYYSTPYVIWANDAAKRVLENDFVGDGPTIGTNFLMNEFFALAGYTGNEYTQYTTDLMQTFRCVHGTGICLTPEGLCRALSPEQEAVYEEFMDVQYYWRNNDRPHE